MPIDGGQCTCPEGWPQLLRHQQDGWPVTIVKHHLRCCASSYRIAGAHRSRAQFEAMVAAALGRRQTEGAA